MHTKERFHLTVRLLCFGLLLAAAGFRLAYDLYRQKPPLVQPEPIRLEADEFPRLPYEPPKKAAQLSFSADDAKFAPVLNWSEQRIDPATLISEPLDFTLSNEPVILILHTHATEAYCNIDGYRTTDSEQNMLRVGTELAERLNQNGLHTLHDTTLIDNDGYYDSYARAADRIEEYLQKYPTIQMVIDIHRDAATDANGQQIALIGSIDGQEAAQMMLVMGTDTTLNHPNWRTNLSFALKLQSLCEREAPGIFRDLNLRAQRYNQHLTPHSILIEVGAAGNTLEQALRSTRLLGDCLVKLLLGAELTS